MSNQPKQDFVTGEGSFSKSIGKSGEVRSRQEQGENQWVMNQTCILPGVEDGDGRGEAPYEDIYGEDNQEENSDKVLIPCTE